MTLATDALSALTHGDYARAKDLYGSLLEEKPESPDYICGFYSSAYWDNRGGQFQNQPQGKARGSALVHAWDQFEQIAADRDFQTLPSFHAAMQSVLGKAAEEFRISFQDTGLAHDSKILLDLGRCLIRMRDYPNAVEILLFARKVKPTPPILLLLGEALCAMGQEDQNTLIKGLGYYRDAFLIEPDVFDPSVVQSEPALSVLTSLYARFESSRDQASLWFPAWLMARSQMQGLRKLLPEEIREAAAELARLNTDLERVVDKFKERVRARICFYILVLLSHHHFHEFNEDDVQELETRLAELEPDLYKDYRDNVTA
jgi:tetratricopeptide (TPR) repeat protein